VLTENQSASLMAAVSSPRRRCQPCRVYFAGARENQNATAKGLVRADAKHHRVQPAARIIWGLLLGLSAPHCPCGHSAFFLPSLALGTGSAHALWPGLHCPSLSSFLHLHASLPEPAIVCKKEEEGKTSTARIHIILLQLCQETDCKSSCI